jgi:heptosyltransferase-2
VVDLHGSLRSRIVRSLVRAALTTVIRKKSIGRFLLVRFGLGRGMSWPTAGERYLACIPGGTAGLEALAASPPSLAVSEGARKAAERLAGGTSPGSFRAGAGTGTEVDPRPFIALAPGARWDTKMWPWERFAEVGLSLARQTGMKILVLGSGGDRELCAGIVRHLGDAGNNLAGETSLMEAAALLGRCALLVTNDTGLMHLAVAVGTPTVAIFGPTSRELGFVPPGPLARIVETNLPCRPCTTIGRRNCPLGSHDCMLQVTTALVLRESLTQLERRKVAKA